VSNIRIPKGWEISESQVTSENAFLNRRAFFRQLGLGSIGALGALAATHGDVFGALAVGRQTSETAVAGDSPYPAPLNAAFSELDRPITPSSVTSRYNNFYESTLTKDVWKYIDQFETKPWQVEIKGAVNKPRIYDMDALVRVMSMEERLYRFRCVEAWAMAVPWTGF